MTDQGASADGQQPGATEQALPDSAEDPQRGEAANARHDPSDVSAEPAPEDVPAGGSAPGIGASTSRFEIVPAYPAGQAYSLMQYLGGLAPDVAQARAALLASALPKINITNFAFPAVAGLAIPPALGLSRTLLPAVSLAAGLPDLGIARRVLPAARDIGFLQGIAAMAGSWDHGLLGIHRDLARSAVVLAVAPHQELLRSMGNLAVPWASAFGSLADVGAMSATAGLVGLFRSWREIAETGLGLLGGLARAAHRAALRARTAVLAGDADGVAWFIRAWLRMRVTPDRVEAVSAALLEDGWDASIPEDPARLLTDLRNRTARQARALRPIWETRLNHQTIGRLDHTVTTSDGSLLTVADLVPDPQTTEDLALAGEYEEQRLRRVLSLLKPDELHVTNVYAGRSELTWTEAARLAGATDPAAMGDRVRRKLRRLGSEHNRRLVQAGRA